MAIVKADAYGHGAVPVARAALLAGASWCGVARLEEALELRMAGLECPILLLGYTPPGQMKAAVAQQVSMTVWTRDHIRQAAEAARLAGEPALVHLKLDTGMGRIGVIPEQVLPLAHLLAHTSGVIFQGLFTHLARADEPEREPTNAQEHLFREALAVLDAEGLRPPVVHVSNSAASLTRTDLAFDMVRLGIAMYGLHPSPSCHLPGAFHPALTWKTVLSHVKMLPPGSGVSYGHEYITKSQERIGTIPVGYADGFRKTASNLALVNGTRVPVLGRVCMDQCMLQLDAVPGARIGDEVILIGPQGSEEITVEDVAQRWGTINYEVVCAIGRRVPRFY